MIKPTNKIDILHTLKNIAQKFRGLKEMQEAKYKIFDAQTKLIESMSSDLDHIVEIMKRGDNGNPKEAPKT